MTWNISHWTSRISPTCWQTPMNFLVWFLENQPTAKISRKKLAHRHPQTGRTSSKNNPRIVRTFKHHLTIIKTYEHIILMYSNSPPKRDPNLPSEDGSANGGRTLEDQAGTMATRSRCGQVSLGVLLAGSTWVNRNTLVIELLKIKFY